ncbi:ArsR/SmtB family transcription factor [Pleionea sediminis]|uniref:ArsR/SmtB family transcription factor n=1 Tax=Pleionea sediminis TaxID=2569479 RepID=UPI001184D042
MEHHTFFKCLSEPVRLRILVLLHHFNDSCVCELVEALNLPQSVVSRHLAYLKKHELIIAYRSSQWMYYHLNIKHKLYKTLVFYLDEFGKSEFKHDIIAMKQVVPICE